MIIDEWFETHTLSILNIYVVSLIIIEQKDYQNKEEQILPTVNLVLETLLRSGKICLDEKEMAEEDIRDNLEVLSEFGKILLEMTNYPNLLQKDKFSKNDENQDIKHLLFCRPASINKFKFGTINK